MRIWRRDLPVDAEEYRACDMRKRRMVELVMFPYVFIKEPVILEQIFDVFTVIV